MIKKPAARKPAPAKKSATPSFSVASPGSDAHYRAQSDMRTLKEAEQIRADSSRHAAAVNHAKAEVGALQKVARKKV